jgi:hypothetical protein
MHAVRIAVGFLLLLVVGCTPSMEARSAGEVGCSPDQITISDDRYHFGLLQTGESWVATCHGRTFVCSQLNETGEGEGLGILFAAKRVSCAEESESPQERRNREGYAEAQRAAAARPHSTAPDGAAGFEFGSSSERAKELCEAAGHRWTTASTELGWCSGPPKALGIQASVALHFCDAQACGISIEHRPTSGWSSKVVSIKAKLASKYGEPKERTLGIPVNCRSEDQFERCLETRELELHYKWAWPSGELLEMNVGRPEGAENAAIRLIYRSGGSAVVESAL